MHVDVIWAFAWIFWYVVSRSIFLIKIHFEGCLRCMAVIIWIILCMQKLHKHGWAVSLSTCLLMDRPYSPGKEKSEVMYILV